MASLTADPYIRIWNRIADHGSVCGSGFDPQNDPDDRKKMWLLLLAAAMFVLMSLFFGSCTRKVYVPVERKTTVVETYHDTVVEVRIRKVHDTVTVEAEGKDTSSYLHNSHSYSHATWKGGKLGHSLGVFPDAKVKDTVRTRVVHVIDSVPYPVVVEVEKKLTVWQKVKIEYGGFAMGFVLALVLVVCIMLSSEKRKRY